MATAWGPAGFYRDDLPAGGGSRDSGEPLEIAAGYVFGNLEGVGLCLLGAAAGTAIIFVFVKVFGIKMVEAFISRKRSNPFDSFTIRRGGTCWYFSYFSFRHAQRRDYLFYRPYLYAPAHFFAALFRRADSSVITSTIVGDALGSENYVMAVAVFVITGLAAAAGLWIYHMICQRRAARGKNPGK